MTTSSIYTDTPLWGSYRIFEIKNDVLVIENGTNNQRKSTSTTIDLTRVSLPATRTKGRNVKAMKIGANSLILLAIVAMGASSIVPDYGAWIWTGALILALFFVPMLLQSLKIAELETFHDAQGRPLFDVRSAKGNEEEFDAFLAALKAAILQSQQRAGANGPLMESGTGTSNGRCSSVRVEGEALPPPLPQADGALSTQAHAGLSPADGELIKKIKSCAHWLYWVAGFSGMNVLFTHLDVALRFGIGLGITELVYAIGLRFGTIGTVAGAVFTVLVLGCLVGLGYAAARRHLWAFLLGIIALFMDTLLLVALTGTKFLVGIVIHLLAIVFLCLGCNALMKLKKRQASGNA